MSKMLHPGQRVSNFLDHYTRSAFSMILIFLVSLALWLFLIEPKNEKPERILATNGTLDLSNYSLASKPAVPLSGVWRFHWEDLISPSIDSFTPGKISKDELINVPGRWDEVTFNGQALDQYGFGTYQLWVHHNHDGPLAFYMPKIGASYALYVNDELLASGGEVAESKENYTPGWHVGVVTFQPPKDAFLVTLQIANFDQQRGGLFATPLLSTPETLDGHASNELLYATFFIGMFITAAVFNMFLFTLQPHNRTTLFLALICLCYALRISEITGALFIFELFELSFESTLKLNYITFYGGMALILRYFQLRYPAEFDGPLIRIAYLLIIIAVLYVLITPPRIFTSASMYNRIVVVLVSLFIIYNMVVAVKQSRIGARLTLASMIVVFVFVINDVLLDARMIDSIPLSRFGLTQFLGCQSYLTYRKFSLAMRTNETLSEQLTRQNAMLQSMSDKLEFEVKQKSDALKKANEELRILAHTDPLTQLPNRRGVGVRTEFIHERFQRQNKPFVVAFIDLDHFKQINDNYGHAEGDEILKQTASVIRKSLRRADVVARWGGEEFLIVLPDTDVQAAEPLLNTMRQKLSEEVSGTESLTVTATIGLAEIRPGERLNDCIKRADEALYNGKAQGRDQVVVA